MPLTNVTPARRLPAFLLLAVLGGCSNFDDPFSRPGTWRVQNVNDANLAAMVSDKRQLVQGVGDNGSPAVLSAQAVRRLLTDHVKPLPTTEIGPLAASPNSGNGGAN